MGVKLLEKSKINELKAKERAIEIREGVKIATRVDGLRELLSKTQEELEAYKTATLTQIATEISALNAKKEALMGELRLMQSHYNSIMPTLETKQDELIQFEKKLSLLEKKLDKRDEKTKLLEIDVAEALRKAEDSRTRRDDNERISRNLLARANESKKEADTTLQTARKIQEQAYAEKENIEKELNWRDLSLQSKERELSSKELLIMNAQTELDKEKIQLQDQRETLRRAMQRIGHGKPA